MKDFKCIKKLKLQRTDSTCIEYTLISNIKNIFLLTFQYLYTNDNIIT